MKEPERVPPGVPGSLRPRAVGSGGGLDPGDSGLGGQAGWDAWRGEAVPTGLPEAP